MRQSRITYPRRGCFAAVQHERKPVLGEPTATKVNSRGARVKPEPQQPVPEAPPAWEQPESPSMEDQSSDSDLSDALTLARERLLISHALDSMAKLIGDVSRRRSLLLRSLARALSRLSTRCGECRQTLAIALVANGVALRWF